MNRENVREAYYEFSGKLSDLARQLALTGVALVWVFKVDVKGAQVVPRELILPALLVVGVLTFDLFQYIYATATWGIYNRLLERRNVGREDEFVAPRAINWPTLVLFWAKIVLLLAAYWNFLIFLSARFLRGA